MEVTATAAYESGLSPSGAGRVVLELDIRAQVERNPSKEDSFTSIGNRGPRSDHAPERLSQMDYTPVSVRRVLVSFGFTLLVAVLPAMIAFGASGAAHKIVSNVGP